MTPMAQATINDTLTYQMDSDVIDDVTVPVSGDSPPVDLRKAVESVLNDTILAMLDGRELQWHDRENGYSLEFVGGLPEYPVGPGQFAPPYRTMENFEGADGSGLGLIGNLPENWRYELENKSSVIFYHD